MSRRVFCWFLILSFALSASPGWCSFWKRTQDRFVVSGSKTYTFQALSISGNRDVFFDDNYTFSSQYRNQTNLTMVGSLLPRLSVAATLSSNRYDPFSQSVALNYEGGRTKASVGDIMASLTGNELISFSKRLQGVTLTQDFGIAKVTAIASQTKASSKLREIQGNNTPGPYYLQMSQIVDGSETVKIDGQEIRRVDSAWKV